MRTTCFDGPAPGTQDPRTENPVLARVTTCQNITMGEFTERLEAVGAGYVQTPVADATGLEGRWTFTVAFSPAAAAPGSPAAPPGALTLQQALERELGLKLEARDRPIPVLVIDKIDSEPRAN
jgi:uncharacterized protein (TIGR03435 family)